MCLELEKDGSESPQVSEPSKPKKPTSSENIEAESNPDRPFSVVIFGASSSVGQFLVEELALVVEKHYSGRRVELRQPTSIGSNSSSSNKHHLRDPVQYAQTNQRLKAVPRNVNNLNWAVAGRSASKLSDTLCRAELSTGIEDLSLKVPVLLADLNHHKSLRDVCSKTNLIINCAGPYSLSGWALIEVCLETKTDYIDLSHEVTYIEQTRRQYSSAARRAGVFIINACGFQSMSAEIGLNFTKQNAEGQINEVKIILSLSDHPRAQVSGRDNSGYGIITRGMWQSLLLEKEQEVSLAERIKAGAGQCGSSSVKRLNKPEKASSQTDEDESGKPLITRKDTQSLVKDVVEFKNRNTLAWLQLITGFDAFGKGYCLPLNSLTSDESLLIQSELTTYEHGSADQNDGCWQPIRSTSFISLKYLSDTVMLLIWMFVFNFFVKLSPLRKLLKLFPYLSSLGNVNNKVRLDRDSMSHIKFCQTFLAYGIPSDNSGEPLEKREKHSRRKQQQLLVARVVGPEPNHVATATFAVQAAIALVLERDHLPAGGGVITPGAAFLETNIIYQLRKRNIKFEVLKKA